jgi:hypothetical protein
MVRPWESKKAKKAEKSPVESSEEEFSNEEIEEQDDNSNQDEVMNSNSEDDASNQKPSSSTASANRYDGFRMNNEHRKWIIFEYAVHLYRFKSLQMITLQRAFCAHFKVKKAPGHSSITRLVY